MLFQQPELDTVVLDGKTFTFKPDTKANVDAVIAHRQAAQQRAAEALSNLVASQRDLQEAEDESAMDSIARKIETITSAIPAPWEQKYAELKLMLDGPWEEVNFDNVSARLIQAVADHFLPVWARG